MRLGVRYRMMDIKTLDFLFPFFICFYGALMTFVLNCAPLVRIAEDRFPATLLTQMRSHRLLALFCLLLGALWSLQNLWFT